MIGGHWGSVLAEHGPVFRQFRRMSVTGELELKGLSGKVFSVRRTPRLVVEAALIQEVGLLFKVKIGN